MNSNNPNKKNNNMMPFENNMAMPYENPVAMPYENPMAMPYENPMAMPYENPMVMPQQYMPYENMATMPQYNIPQYNMPQQYNPMAAAPQVNCPMLNMGFPMPIQPQYYPMVTMPDEQLENMYPKTYKIVNPVVQSYCDKIDVMSNPTKEQLAEICEKICKDVEGKVEKVIAEENKDDKRQLGFGGRIILRDLAGILLIRELLRRRQFYGYPGYGFPGYGGFYGY
ncbi:hypothetical protein [Acetivibrio clariflavus]|uniref:Uncharacterized protein n=1 Tax=Acetivibrio clariflavus (strain DSM 19732 / NBRC 101661 / EBR45) TaxID=720554 RepID=G8LSP3_ACECE|nr:hypothetical protein [Acetivibrio clariflavus]AEV69395.1 hypothetical protein Clocl_2846 [Acetivibrio clariflavus DSM 19732]